jgi:hypothetical protein
LNVELRTLKGEGGGIAGTQRRGEGDEAKRVGVVLNFEEGSLKGSGEKGQGSDGGE